MTMAKNNFKKFVEFVCDVLSFVAALVCMVIAICAMLVADVVAIFIYPVYMTLWPEKAAKVDSISGWIGFEWLEDMCELKHNISWPFSWLNMVLHFMDAVVIALLSWVTAWTAPMRIRFWFIDNVSIHKPNIQKKYFQMSDEGGKINLIKYGHLDKDVLLELFRENHEPFIKAGKIEDDWFLALGIEECIRYSQLHTLGAYKMKAMLNKADDLRITHEVTRVIRLNGLSVEVLNWFHGNIKPERSAYQTIKSALKDHEQAVTVLALQTGEQKDGDKFVEYIRLNHGLGKYAQKAMSKYQYMTFHKEGYKLEAEVINSKLRDVAKEGFSSKSAHFIPMFVEYKEIAADNEVAHDLIASSEVLTKMVYA